MVPGLVTFDTLRLQQRRVMLTSAGGGCPSTQRAFGLTGRSSHHPDTGGRRRQPLDPNGAPFVALTGRRHRRRRRRRWLETLSVGRPTVIGRLFFRLDR